MKKLVNTALFLLVIFPASFCFAGPFGFDYGMSKQQIIRLVGRDAVAKETEDTLELKTAPKPHSAFELYICVISPQKGLLKVGAIGVDVETSSSGFELRHSFDALEQALTDNYGTPEKTFDFLQAGSIWNEPQDWMMGLLKHDRVLAYYWSPKPGAIHHIESIGLEAKALSSEKGYIVLSYEFEGFEQYADQKKAQKDQVL